MDISKVKPFGPWVLVKVDRPEETTEGGVYVPDGNLLERLGHATGVVLRCGEGYFNTGKKAKTKFTPVGVKPGDRVVFRGHLQEANRPGGVLDREHSLIHGRDLVGKLIEGKLDLALPYDN